MTKPFENAKIGDVVYHLCYGYGKIMSVGEDTLIYRPDTAKNDDFNIRINKDGFIDGWNNYVINRVLYWKEPKIIEQ
jgi:hypothetical protein